MPIGALVGAPLAGWLVDYIGRKKSLLLCSFPFAVGWVITILSHIVPSHEDTWIRIMLFCWSFPCWDWSWCCFTVCPSESIM